MDINVVFTRGPLEVQSSVTHATTRVSLMSPGSNAVQAQQDLPVASTGCTFTGIVVPVGGKDYYVRVHEIDGQNNYLSSADSNVVHGVADTQILQVVVGVSSAIA